MRKVASTTSVNRSSNVVADKLHSASIHLLRTLRLQDEESGIGPARLSALSILVFVGPKSLRDLAAMEQVRAPTMSRIVDGLEADGFAVRKSDKEDGRSILVCPTAKGIKLLQDARKRRVDELARRLNKLSESECEILLNAAELIGAILNR